MAQFFLEWEDIFRMMSWIYSLAWCLSFYGQICQNLKRKNVEGMNLNFAAINLNGFAFYALFNCYGYFIDDSQSGRVQLPDLFFALHAFAATFFTAIQAIIYPKGANKLSKGMIGLIASQWIILIVYYILTYLIQEHVKVGLVSLMGYYKLMCSLIKYIPQLLWNRKRKSTMGWSIFNVLMDLTGGIFSVSQIILQSIFLEGFKLNITKLLLGLLTIIYDLIFVYQHFFQYSVVLELKEETFEIIASDSPSAFNRQSQESIQTQ